MLIKGVSLHVILIPFFSLRIYHIINLLERNCCNNAGLYTSLYIYLYFLMPHVHRNTLTFTILFVSPRIYSFSGLFIIQRISLKRNSLSLREKLYGRCICKIGYVWLFLGIYNYFWYMLNKSPALFDSFRLKIRKSTTAIGQNLVL